MRLAIQRALQATWRRNAYVMINACLHVD